MWQMSVVKSFEVIIDCWLLLDAVDDGSNGEFVGIGGVANNPFVDEIGVL